jgi:hypothetical protein
VYAVARLLAATAATYACHLVRPQMQSVVCASVLEKAALVVAYL